MTQPVEAFVPVSPSVDPTAKNLRQLLIFEYQPSSGTFVQVNAEVIALMDPVTGTTIQAATFQAQDEANQLMRGVLKALVEVLNLLADKPGDGGYSADDFMKDDEEAGASAPVA